MLPTFLANPWGLLGLLAIPAILIIHMLREKSRTVRVSTLFLLQAVPPRTPRGRALHWIQNSIPLWLQLLAAFLGTWLLCDPRWVRANSFQSVAVILDSSASMSVGRERVKAELPPLLRKLSRQAGRTDWIISTDDTPGAPLYHGPDATEAIAALEQWQPLLPKHDPAPAFATALAQARGQGTILYISDAQPEALPAGVTLHAFGRAIENCGFAGVRTWREADGFHWEVIIKNSGALPQDRDCWFEAGAVKTSPRAVHLAPGGLETIAGVFPGEERRLTLHLAPDTFTLDDTLPLVAPEPKALTVGVGALPGEMPKLFERVLKTVPAVSRTADLQNADVSVVPAAQLGFLPPERAGIGLGGKVDGSSPLGAIAAEAHALMDGLVWEGLLSQGAPVRPLAVGEQALLWQGDRPLIVLQASPQGAPRLFFNFDVATSNADRLPAFVLLLTRFLDSVRDTKNAPFSANFETGQALPLAADASFEIALDEKRQKPAPGRLNAPRQPGFFTIYAKETALLQGAAHFGDPREADFQQAMTSGSDTGAISLIRQINSLPDPLANLWLVILAAALLGAWAAHARDLRGAVAAT